LANFINKTKSLKDMAINFIKNIAENKTDKATHNVFVRYGMGEFEKEDFIIKKSGANVKIWAGFEYVNVLLRFAASLCSEEVSLSGVIPTVKDISSLLAKYNIQAEAKARYGKSGKRFEFTVTLSPEKAKQFIEEFNDFYLLLDLSSGKRQAKIKKKETPKIGSPAKKFIAVTLPKEDFGKVVNEFLFDAGVNEFSEAVIKQTYKITGIDVDEKLLKTDAEKARLEAKREGTILRKITIDGKEIIKEYKFKV
jgi:hypothetical protein